MIFLFYYLTDSSCTAAICYVHAFLLDASSSSLGAEVGLKGSISSYSCMCTYALETAQCPLSWSLSDYLEIPDTVRLSYESLENNRLQSQARKYQISYNRKITWNISLNLMYQIIVAAVLAIYFSSCEEWATWAGFGFIEETDVVHSAVSN